MHSIVVFIDKHPVLFFFLMLLAYEYFTFTISTLARMIVRLKDGKDA